MTDMHQTRMKQAVRSRWCEDKGRCLQSGLDVEPEAGPKLGRYHSLGVSLLCVHVLTVLPRIAAVQAEYIGTWCTPVNFILRYIVYGLFSGSSGTVAEGFTSRPPDHHTGRISHCRCP